MHPDPPPAEHGETHYFAVWDGGRRVFRPVLCTVVDVVGMAGAQYDVLVFDDASGEYRVETRNKISIQRLP